MLLYFLHPVSALKRQLPCLILPGVFNVFYLLIMRTFVSAIPTALIESAKIDGAGEFKTFFSIILPLLKSGMATIGLFLALGYWNDWYNAMLYMNTETKYPLQYMLYALMQKTQAMSQMASSANIPLQDMPSNSLKLPWQLWQPARSFWFTRLYRNIL